MIAVDRRNLVILAVVVLLVAAIGFSCGKTIGPAEGASGLLLFG